MRKRSALIGAVLALTALAWLIIVTRPPPEPIAHGMPASYWLELSDGPAHAAETTLVFKEMGTNALPFFERTLRTEDSPLRTNFVKWLSRHTWLESKLKLGPPAWVKHGLALREISRLGPAGQPALPDIVPFTTNQILGVKITALNAFKSIRPDSQMAKPYVPTLLYALGDKYCGSSALDALAAIHPMPPEVAPALSHLMQNTSGREMGLLLYHLQHSWTTNTNYLSFFDQLLHDTNDALVNLAALRIGDFGAAAAGSVPRLQELLNDPSRYVRAAVGYSLFEITGQWDFPSAAPEKADISYDFPGIPFKQFLDIYEDLSGRSVAMRTSPPDNKILRVITPRPLTRSEALKWLALVLKEQAGLVTVCEEDGSLMAVPEGQR